MVADAGLARRLCSFQAQAQAQVPIDGLTPRQAIDLLGQLRGASKADAQCRRQRLVEALDLGEWLDVDPLGFPVGSSGSLPSPWPR
jgi:ABC-2 type transport system ATP-binding protein